MKKLSLVLIVAALALPQAGQAGWFRTYGDSGYDEGHCVQQTSDGGYIVTGYTKSYNAGKAALWLLKTDTLGNTVWSKTYGATDSTEAVGYFVCQNPDGGYIVTGKLRQSESQIWLLKTDKNGDTLWTKKFYSGFGVGYCVQNTEDSCYVLTGMMGGFPNSLLFLLKLNPMGDSVWMKTYLPSDWVASIGYSLKQTTDKGFVLTGLVADTSFEIQKSALCLIRTDSLGNTLWTYNQGGKEWGDWEEGRCVLQTIDNNYTVVTNIGLLKVTNVGDSLWMRKYQDGSCIEETQDSGYILSGGITQLLSSQSNNLAPSDMWLLHTSQNGDSLWQRRYSSGNLFHVSKTVDKGFIATGVNGDLVLIKTDSLGLLGITENPIVVSDNGWNVPHSIGSYVVLHYTNLPQGFRANVFDVSGQKVDQIRGDGNEGAMTWGINYLPGVYFIQALDNRSQLKTEKVILVR